MRTRWRRDARGAGAHRLGELVLLQHLRKLLAPLRWHTTDLALRHERWAIHRAARLAAAFQQQQALLLVGRAQKFHEVLVADMVLAADRAHEEEHVLR